MASNTESNDANRQARRWCFTIYESRDRKLDEWNFHEIFKDWRVTYMIIGKETCPDTERKHFQGFIHLKDKKRFNQIKKRLPTACIRMASGSDLKNKKYCEKEGEIYHEEGTVSAVTEKGGSDIGAKIREIVAEGSSNPVRYIRKHRDDSMRTVYARYHQSIEKLAADKEMEDSMSKIAKEYVTTKWRIWQTKLIEELRQKPDPRKVIWYADPTGQTGKTYLARYLLTSGEKVVLFCNAKSLDLKFIYKGEKIAIFDYTRSDKNFINYSILESLKNGYLCSTKYAGCIKVFPVPHVVVFSNSHPKLEELSADRWDVRTINPDELAETVIPTPSPNINPNPHAIADEAGPSQNL